MVLFTINHFQTPTLRKLICQLPLKSHFCHTFVNSFGIPLLPEAGSIGNILSCHIVTNKPDQIVNIFLLIFGLQHPWLRGFIFFCCAFDRPSLNTFLLSSHFHLHRQFSLPAAIPAPSLPSPPFAPVTPVELTTSTMVNPVTPITPVTPVNPITPVTPVTLSPPSPSHPCYSITIPFTIHHGDGGGQLGEGGMRYAGSTRRYLLLLLLFFTSKCPI